MCPKEILEFILRKENLSYPKLAKKMGISRTQPLYDIRDGKIKAISANYANRIINAFPESGYTFGFIITGDESLINSEEPKGEDEIIFSDVNKEEDATRHMNAITERFLRFIDNKGLSDYQVWNAIDGLSKSSMSKIRGGLIDVSIKIVASFCEVYGVDANWLLTGKGEMTKQPTNQEIPVSTNNSDMESAFLKKEAFYLRQMNERLDDLIKANETIENLKEEVESLKKQLELAEQDSNKMAVNVVKHKFA